MAERVFVFDTTLRDGEQAPGFSMRVPEKLAMARQLARLGADIIEAGFPIASEADAEAVHLLARATPADVDRAGWAIGPASVSRIHTFIATSDLHLTRKLRMSREECLDA